MFKFLLPLAVVTFSMSCSKQQLITDANLVPKNTSGSAIISLPDAQEENKGIITRSTYGNLSQFFLS